MYRLVNASKLLKLSRLKIRNIREISVSNRLCDDDDDVIDDGPRELGIDESWKPPRIEFDPDDNPIYKTYKESIEEDDFYDEEILYKPKNVKDVENAESGNFKCGEFQGWGEDDQIDKMFFPEWRTSYSIRDRYTVRPNSSYLEEVYHGHWDQIKRDEDEIEKVMDMKWDEYVDMFGFTPAEYIGSPAYKAKYGENQKCWHDHVKNRKQHWWGQSPRKNCYAPAHTTQNACPLHRDYMLLPHYKNIPLIEQFICEFTGNPVAPLRSGLCLQATLEIDWALQLAYDKGYLLQPFRMYKPGDGWGLERPDYSEKLFRIDRTQHFRKSQN